MKLFYVATISFIYLVLSIVYIPHLAATPVKVVVIDAGHGGHDPGAIGITGVKEKDIVLKLALQLGALIEKNHPEIKVIYTRKTDVFVDLRDRAQLANNNKADIFISIHCNAVDKNSGVNGTETFVMGLDKSDANLAIAQKENAVILKEQNYESNYDNFDPYSAESYIMFRFIQNKYLDQSTKLAAAIQTEFKSLCKLNDRGVKQAPFMVLYRSAMPSVLVEAGFLSNKTEEAYLASAKGQAELATAMYNGFTKMIEAKTVAVDFTGIDTTTQPSKTPSETTPNATPSNSQTKVVYRVQFMFASKKLEKNDPELKNMPDIEIEKVGNGYKYTAGNFNSHGEAGALLAKAKEVGFKDAFIVSKNVKQDINQESKQEVKQETKPEVKPTPTKVSRPKITYKIQFMTLARILETNDPYMKGLPDIEIHKTEYGYTYTTGKYSTHSQAQQQLSKVKEAGFDDAFIVSHKTE